MFVFISSYSLAWTLSLSLTQLLFLFFYLPITERSLPLTGPRLVLGLDDHDAALSLTQLDAVLLQVGLGRFRRNASLHAHDNLGPLDGKLTYFINNINFYFFLYFYMKRQILMTCVLT
jgi:hypothetical protein